MEQTLAAFYAGEFPGGEAQVKDAKLDGVELPMATSRFNTFSQADYDEVFGRLVNDEIKLLNDTDVESVDEIPTELVTVTEIK